MKGYKPHKYKLGEVVNKNLRIVDQVWIEGPQRKLRAYIVQSITYPKAKTYTMRESYIMKGVGCAYVAGRKVCPENSLWNVKSIRDNIIDVEESKNVTSHSHRKLMFKCSSDNCDNAKIMKAQTLSTQGYSCPNCSSGISYAERFGLAMNKYFNLGFKYQEQYEDGRFDFVSYDMKVVVEMNGRQHYEDNSWEGSYENTKKSDDKKRKWCDENGYTLIFIDARKSEFEFIRDNINACEHLPNIKKEDEKTIMSLIETSSKYDVQEIIRLYEKEKLSTVKIAKMYGLAHGTISRILLRNGIDMRGYEEFKRAVICIETKKIYASLTEAMNQTGIDRRNIGQCLSGRTKSAGGFHWEFVD